MPQPTVKRPRILVISQVYVPDPASVGQHMADAAQELVRRGYDVRVLTSARGYDDPTQKYPPRETLGGVDVVRLPLSSLGKRSIAVRLVAQAMFLAQALAWGLFTPRLCAILVSTSPPMASIVAVAIRFVRRVPIKFWVMDLNPDQVVATGRFKPGSLPVRVFDWINRRILGAASDIVALDTFMAKRLEAKRPVGHKITVLPPWPHEDVLDPIAKAENPFVARHGLSDKFVVMYSGNHGLTTPVDTLVEAGLRLQDHPTLRLMFVGGGPGKAPVERAIADHAPKNIVSLPYQPLAELRYSLSAADVHVVLMNEDLVGIVHPCKVYGAMAVGRPILYFGPRPSHITEVLDEGGIGWTGVQGDVDGAVRLLEEIARTPAERLAEMGRKAQEIVRHRLGHDHLRGQFCDVVTRGLPEPPAPAGAG